MTNLLRKLFIKDYKNTKDSNVRAKHALLASVVGICQNILLFVVKLVLGLIVNSISMIADGINNLADSISALITYISVKLASRPADKEHPYGHQRGEYVAYLIVSIIMFVVSFELFRSSVEKIIYTPVTEYSYLILAVLAITVLIKIHQGIFYLKMSKLTASLPLKGASKDSFSDVIATAAIILGGLFYLLFNINIDGYLGILVSILIAKTAFDMIKEAINPLIGTKAPKDFIKQVVNDVLAYPGVLGVHDVISHNYGPNHIFTSLHVEVDAKADILVAHELIDDIEQTLAAKYQMELVIHMDPILVDCPETNELKQKIKIALEALSEDISFHDFRIVKGMNCTNIIFDIAMPFGIDITEKEVISYLYSIFNKKEYNLKIHFDLLYEENQAL